MEISQHKQGETLVIRLEGRLDANWCGHVEKGLAQAVRAGEHRIHLDMAGVDYISSAGLRVLLSIYKQLGAIKGTFGVIRPSVPVRSVLDLAGLGMIVTEVHETTATSTATRGAESESPRARYEVFPIPTATQPMKLTLHGDPTALQGGGSPTQAQRCTFDEDSFALGVGALGARVEDCAPRFGELLAVAGAAAYQPSDGSSQPDFVLREGGLIPEGYLFLGLAGRGHFQQLARFEAKPEARTVPLSELAEKALSLSGASAAVVVGVVETAGLVGAILRRSPASSAADPGRFAFPGIRDWLSFTPERAYRDTTSLVVGVVAREGTPWQPLLRPLAPGLLGHFHAASFPYRPLQKDLIDLKTSVADLFDGHNLQAVLHLLTDAREFTGAGESDFLRGALWISPLAS